MKRKLPYFIIGLFTLCLLGLKAEDIHARKNADRENVTAVESKTTVTKVKVTELSDSEFKKIVGQPSADRKRWEFQSDKPMLIDFYAKWCGPCRMLSPIIDKMAQEFDGQIEVYKMNVDKTPQTATLFQISSIPALLYVMPQNKKLLIESGYLEENELRKNIKRRLVK